MKSTLSDGDDLVSSVEHNSSSGNLIRIYYQDSVDDISAAAQIFVYAFQRRARILARSFNQVVDLSKVLSESRDGELIIIVGGIVIGEYKVKGREVFHLVTNHEPKHEYMLTPPNVMESNALWTFSILGCDAMSAAVRALVGYYSTRCYLLEKRDLCEGDELLIDELARREIVRVIERTLMLALRKSAPLDLSLASTPYPSLEGLSGNRGAARDLLSELGICEEGRCPPLERIENDEELMASLTNALGKLSSEDRVRALVSSRSEIVGVSGWLADASDLALALEAYSTSTSRSPQGLFAEILQGYPTMGHSGLLSLLEMSDNLKKIAFSIRKSSVKGRALFAEPGLNEGSLHVLEPALKSMLYSQLGEDPLALIKVAASSHGVTYLAGSRDPVLLDSFLKEMRTYGARYTSSGPIARIWIPSASEERVKRELM